MPRFPTVFAQILRLIPRTEFERLAREHGARKRVRSFSCWAQLGCLLYAQLSRQMSLRDLVLALDTKQGALYQIIGVRQVRRSTLADANECRSYRTYEALFAKLYQQCLQQVPAHRFRFRQKLYSFDASVVDLCLSVFPWAKFRRTKGAIKLHALLDHDGHIPSFVQITTAKTHDIQEARKLVLEPDSILVFDRGYIDYAWFYQIHLHRAFFVTRLKRGAVFRVVARREPPSLSGVTSDQTIRMTGSKPDSIPIDLRRIGYIDPGTGRHYFFLTNNFRLSAKTIAEIYRARWQVELFFKWIKQHLRIKTFIGTSENAVMSQVYVAMIAYLVLTYVKYSTRSPLSLYEIAKRVEVSLFDRVELRALLAPHVGSKHEQQRLDRPVQLCFKWFANDSEPCVVLKRIRTEVSPSKALVAQGR